MKRGNIKVMIDRNGTPRVQEELGDSLKVYSLEEWNKELEKRALNLDKVKVDTEKKVEEVIAAEKPQKETKLGSIKKVSKKVK